MRIDTPEYANLFEAMIRACGESRPRGRRQREVTAFWPTEGSAYRPGESLMIVGRAVNGWLDDPLRLDGTLMDDAIRRHRDAARARVVGDRPEQQ